MPGKKPAKSKKKAPQFDSRHEVPGTTHGVRVRPPEIGIEVGAPKIDVTRETEAKFKTKKTKKLPKW